MKRVATIETDYETGKRAGIYIQRESYDGRWKWVVYAKSRGEEPVKYNAEPSREDALESIRLLWGNDCDLQWTEGSDR